MDVDAFCTRPAITCIEPDENPADVLVTATPYTPPPPPVKVASEDRSVLPYRPVPPVDSADDRSLHNADDDLRHLIVVAPVTMLSVVTQSPLAQQCTGPEALQCPAPSADAPPGAVIGANEVCDGEDDCGDAADEHECTAQACQTSFHCPSTRPGRTLCLRSDRICDGRPDCADVSDEAHAMCHATEDKCDTRTSFMCESSTYCIPRAWLCDGEEHCPNGDDEKNCTACANGAFMCKAAGVCVAPWNRCDGRRHCADGSDEEQCSCDQCQGNGAVLCSTSGKQQCIQPHMVCDRKPDCDGGEDEKNCAATLAIVPGGNTTAKAVCHCPSALAHVVCRRTSRRSPLARIEHRVLRSTPISNCDVVLHRFHPQIVVRFIQ